MPLTPNPQCPECHGKGYLEFCFSTPPCSLCFAAGPSDADLASMRQEKSYAISQRQITGIDRNASEAFRHEDAHKRTLAALMDYEAAREAYASAPGETHTSASRRRLFLIAQTAACTFLETWEANRAELPANIASRLWRRWELL